MKHHTPWNQAQVILNSISEKGLIAEERRLAKLVGFVPFVPNVFVVVFKERIYENVPSSSVGAAMPQLCYTEVPPSLQSQKHD